MMRKAALWTLLLTVRVFVFNILTKSSIEYSAGVEIVFEKCSYVNPGWVPDNGKN